MKIAVPTRGTVVDDHFGHCEFYTLFTVNDAKEITEPLPEGVRKVGVCGATSTPKWLMEEVAEKVKRLNIERKLEK